MFLHPFKLRDPDRLWDRSRALSDLRTSLQSQLASLSPRLIHVCRITQRMDW
jgi:hypothetical protein